jgi:hypothetical protein
VITLFGLCWRCEEFSTLVKDPMFFLHDALPSVCPDCADKRAKIAVEYKQRMRKPNA